MLHCRGITVICISLVFGMSAVAADAAGRREDTVRQAEQLAAEQRYNEALQLLAQAIKDDPDRIWDATQLIQQISQFRNQYNQEWRELIRSLSEYPDDSGRALEIIQRMEEIDQFPNPRTSQQVRDARRTVRFRYNQAEFLAIMEEAGDLIDAQQYVPSMQRYASGFDLFREEFMEAGYGNIFENRVLGLADRLTEVVESAPEAIAALEQQRSSWLQRVQNPAEAESVVQEITDIVGALEEYRLNTVRVATALEEENERIPLMNEEMNQDWYLVFLNRFALGRRDAEQAEGIAGVPVRAIQEILGVIIEQAFVVSAQLRSNQLSAFDAGNWADAEIGWLLLAQYAEHMMAMERIFISLHDTTGQHSDTERIVANRSAQREVITALEQYSLGMAEVVSRLSSFIQLARIQDKSAEQLQSDAERLQLVKGVVQDQLNAWNFTDSDLLRIAEYETEYLTRLEEWDDKIKQAQADLYHYAAELRIPPFFLALQEYDTVIVAAEQEIAGIDDQETPVEDDLASVRRFPQNALPRLQTLQGQLNATRLQLDQLRLFVDEIPRDIAADERILQHRETVLELENRFAGAQSATAELIETAMETIRLASEADTQGRQLLSQAEDALVQRNIEQARRLLEQADSRFFESLNYRYDEDVRQEYQTLTSNLGEQIVETQIVLVIEQVRDRITRARTLFQQDDFFAAEQVLQEAQDLWDTVNPGEANAEIRNWLGLVRAALNLQTNREIAEDSPLYYTLVPFLSQANDQYQRGVALLEQGNRDQAETMMTRAEDNLNAVISAQPFNQEARVLQLRIQQQIDPEAFEQTFEARLSDALARRDAEPQEALVDLQDLAAIRPGYPGIDQAIVQLEIALGIRQAPIDRTAQIASNQLVERARQVAAGGTREQLQAAVGLLEEAIEVNPENQSAITLLDQYRISIGGQVTTTISFEAQQRFRQAENLFVQGDLAAAYAIVQQLLQSQQNRRYTPLINLQRRLESRLGI